MSPTARQTTGLIANFAAITLTTRFHLRLQLSDSVLAALSYMAQYFTLLTNTMAFILMVWIAMHYAVSPHLVRAVIISLVCFGLIYRRLLAHLVSLSGIELWADHETHTVVSLLAGIWLLLLAPKPKIKAGDIALWIAWPLIYYGYILFRGSFSRFYPYPFLNVPEIG